MQQWIPLAPGDALSLLVTAVTSYFVLFLLTRLVGNKQISQMTMFDYISGISIGSIAAEMASELESPLRPLLAMVVYGLLTWGIALWTNKSLAARRIFTGKPLILLKNGVILRENLKKARLDLGEFLTLCRVGGWFDPDQLDTVVFEHNGNLSFLPREAYRPAQPTDLGKNPQQSPLFLPVVLDGQVLPDNLRRQGRDERWLARRLAARGYADAQGVLLALCADGELCRLYPRDAT